MAKVKINKQLTLSYNIYRQCFVSLQGYEGSLLKVTSKNGKTASVSQCIIYFRKHPDQLSNNTVLVLQDNLSHEFIELNRKCVFFQHVVKFISRAQSLSFMLIYLDFRLSSLVISSAMGSVVFLFFSKLRLFHSFPLTI